MMKKGYTTGSCSAAATMAAIEASLNRKFNDYVTLKTPNGEILNLEVLEKKLTNCGASCAIMKNSGDDPDVTNESLVFSEVKLIDEDEFKNLKALKENIELENRIILKGGQGVGKITKPGLACDIGEPAINPVPRKMIGKCALEAMQAYEYEGFVEITIAIPAGISLAEKTFNPKLGIIGGISVLGTTGIVEPMSEQALVDTIKVEMNVCKASKSDLVVITPGNYGKYFLKNSSKLSEDIIVKCSNFIGDALIFAQDLNFKKVILSGHLGKLIKVAGGVMNTHSKYGDRRMEIIMEHALRCGADSYVLEKISQCVMVDEAVRILDVSGIKDVTMEAILESIVYEMKKKITNADVGVIIFTNKYGLLACSDNIDRLLDEEI